VKKFLVLCVVMCGLGTAVYAAQGADKSSGTGIGAVFSGGWGGAGYGSLGLSLKPASTPLYFGIGLRIKGDYFGMSVSADIRFIDDLLPLEGAKLYWFLAGGAYGHLAFGSDMGLAAGARLPIGIDWRPSPKFDLALAIVPSLGLAVLPDIDFPYYGFDGELCLRYWF